MPHLFQFQSTVVQLLDFFDHHAMPAFFRSKKQKSKVTVILNFMDRYQSRLFFKEFATDMMADGAISRFIAPIDSTHCTLECPYHKLDTAYLPLPKFIVSFVAWKDVDDLVRMNKSTNSIFSQRRLKVADFFSEILASDVLS